MKMPKCRFICSTTESHIGIGKVSGAEFEYVTATGIALLPSIEVVTTRWKHHKVFKIVFYWMFLAFVIEWDLTKES